MTEREKIIKVIDEWANKAVKANKFDGASVYNPHNAAELADALIAAGYGDVKEIKYRVRRAEKALYIACRETAEIIFKDDFDRHAQEYMYGYLIQAEKELAEEWKDD